ncbi:hypothetical protein [Krasilnikovia sp. MM14-A1004]|uniref:hypothetical protein n=1 Tax=Krasilnikovia sp. MM14-A1004 TaxID=3373541 RepID=UPI00399D4BCB
MSMFEQHVDAALRELDFAAAHDDAASAINALTRIGLAEAALGPRSLTDAPEAATQREALRAAAGGHGPLIARAAANVDVPMRRGDEGLVDALLARTGYQVLLDLGAWAQPPLDDFHLGEADDELADAVAAGPPEVPDGIPRTHRWWWPAG